MTDAPKDDAREPDSPPPAPAADLTKHPSEQPHEPLDFDPYRFGRPEHPVPPEYAPHGYVPPPDATPPPAQWPPTPSSAPQWPPTAQQYGGYPPQYGQWGQPPAYGPYQGGQYQGAPLPPPGYQYGAVKSGNTKATVALVLGILSIVFFWASFLDLVLVVPAIVLGAIAMGEARRFPQRGGRGPALTGLVCGLIGALFAASFTVWVYVRAKDCFDNYDYHSDAFNTCVQNKL